ncbi:MAG: hypothetical protein HWE39_15190 [Oceanospirillaceae bacterium]|nr:hypothetical protein [Oceanospirillaceae bacterium]
MTATRHKPGVREARLVKRHLRFKALDSGRASVITDEIRRLGGVDSVELEADARRLNVATNLRRSSSLFVRCRMPTAL